MSTITTDADTLPRSDHSLIVWVLGALFLAALDQTILGPAMGDIARQLGGGDLLTWVATAYLMAATASAPILGAFADLRGRRAALYLAIGLFIIGSTLAALAPNLEMLVLARVIQGAGAGGLTSLPYVVIADRVPMQRRAVYSAYTSTIYAIAAIFGPVAGGFLAQYLHWNAIFWLNVPAGVAVIVAIAVLYRKEVPPQPRSVDYLGAFLLVGGTSSSVMTLNTATGAGAHGPAALLWLLAAIVCWICFWLRMTRARAPLLPMTVLTEPTTLLCALGLLCCTGANIGLSVYLPLYYQQAFGLSSSEAGFAVMGFLVGVMSGAYIPPRLLLRDPRYKRLVVASSLLALLAGLGLTLVLAVAPSLWLIEIATIALGLGIGSSYPIFTLATQNTAGRERMGAALGLLGLARGLGGTVGVASVGAVAVASGLTMTATHGEAAAHGLPMWTISLVAVGLLAVCVVAMTRLPSLALLGYGGKR